MVFPLAFDVLRRAFLTHLYVPPLLLQLYGNLRQKFIDFWKHRKQQLAPALPTTADKALNRLIMIANKSSDKIPTSYSVDELIHDVLNDAEQRKNLLQCGNLEAQRLLNLFYCRLRAGSIIFCQSKLRVMTIKLAIASEKYPLSCYLEDVIVFPTVECSGGCANIHKGEWKGRLICAKTRRIYQNTDWISHSQAVTTEILLSLLVSECRHPNIILFLGIHQMGDQVYLISPWMKNGNMTEYLRRNRTSNRSHLVVDIAQGLTYLHNIGIVHKDLKGRNILVDDQYRAVLTDFGSSFTVNDAPPLSSLSCGGTVRWQAPELFKYESSESLPDSGDQGADASMFRAIDVYAFGMVCSEIYTGQVPFARFKGYLAVKARILAGKRPERPVEPSDSWNTWGLTENIWSLMEACWRHEPEERPPIREVLDRLR